LSNILTLIHYLIFLLKKEIIEGLKVLIVIAVLLIPLKNQKEIILKEKNIIKYHIKDSNFFELYLKVNLILV
jgi:hypothetical protein